VDDDGSGGTLTSSADVFVVPAAVVETSVALEQVRVPIGIVVQHQQDLALQISSLVVVPVVFGGLDPVADKHHLGIFYLRALRLDTTGSDVLVPDLYLQLAVCGDKAPGLRQLAGDADELERLLPGTIGCPRLQTQRLHAVGQIGSRLFVTRAGRAPSFELVACQLGDMLGYELLIDDRRGFLDLGRKGRWCLGGRLLRWWRGRLAGRQQNGDK
jgi:hypothetical protein